MSEERVLLAILDDKDPQTWSVEDSLHEMKELVAACHGMVVDHVVCRGTDPKAATLITPGKVQEIKAACDAQEINLVIIGSELKGVQQRNLEKAFDGIRTIDRTQLILDIFARRAHTREGKLQVELAQLAYQLPRLVGKGQALSRLGGGIGTLGPGETKLEIDRRRIQERVTKLKRDLEHVTQTRQLKRKRRTDKRVPMISLVGYTNAGKSTLLNMLTQAGTETKDGLFTTLDSLARQVVLPNRQTVVFSDTVGFLHELPHTLIEAFKATLEEVEASDILLHVIDGSYDDFPKLYASVMDVLKELHISDKPMIIVGNKIDAVDDVDLLQRRMARWGNVVMVSAKTGEGVEGLLLAVEEALTERFVEIDVCLSLDRMDLIHAAHQQGEVTDASYTENYVRLRATIPLEMADHFLKADIEI